VKRLTLHIGVPKTGSTTLQTTLLENWDVFQRRSCDYISAPQSAGIGRHNLAWEYSDDPRFKPAGGTWQQAREHIDASSNAHFLYSSEVLSRLSPDAIGRIRSITAGLDVRVVMFVRNHIDLLESGWSSAGELGWYSRGSEFDDYLQSSLEWSSHRFYSTYTHWAEAFGAESVTVIPHETTDDVVESFLHAAGLSDAVPELRPVKSGKVSMHPHFWAAVDEIERVLGANTDEGELRRLREELRQEAERQGLRRPPRGSLLGPRAAEILDRFSDEVRQLHDHVVRLPDVYFVPPEVAPLQPPSPDELREWSILLLGGALLRWERKGPLSRALGRWEKKDLLSRPLARRLTGRWRAV